MSTVVLGIFGITNFSDYPLIEQKIKNYIARACPSLDQIISSTGDGINAMAEDFSIDHGYPCKVMAPDWDAHDKAARFILNDDVVQRCTHVIVVWDQKDRVMKDLREKMLAAHKNLFTINVVTASDTYKKRSRT